MIGNHGKRNTLALEKETHQTSGWKIEERDPPESYLMNLIPSFAMIYF